jgi:hypothetical protein
MISNVSSNYKTICGLFNFGKSIRGHNSSFLSLKKIKLEIKKLGIKSIDEYIKYRKENNKTEWPGNPTRKYAVKWRDILEKKLLSLSELKLEVKKLGITNEHDYRKYRKSKNKTNWPSSPDDCYGIKIRKLFDKEKIEHLSLKKIKEELVDLKITKVKDYKKYRKDNNKTNWPGDPLKKYGIKWRELFSKEKINYLPFHKLNKELEKLGIKSGPKYKKYRKDNNKINWPAYPVRDYKLKGWGELFQEYDF